MKILFLVLTFFFTSWMSAQKGDATLYFKNGDTISGIGKLKGAEFIKFRKNKKDSYKLIGFDKLHKADVANEDTIVSFALFPIVKKNGKVKTASVIGLYEIGEVNLYAKGEIKKIIMQMYTFNSNGMPGFVSGGVGDAPVHYFLRKNNETKAVHVGSNLREVESALKNTEHIFSKCPELIKSLLIKSNYDTTMFEIVRAYNIGCTN